MENTHRRPSIKRPKKRRFRGNQIMKYCVRKQIKFRGLQHPFTYGVNIDGLQCSAFSAPGSGNGGKEKIQTSRTLERKISINQRSTKDVLMPVKHNVFPVEPSGCRRGAFTGWRNV
ncbi:hypothetical protein TNCV_2361651 [Trichonephila clavipes]|nr:hypothetical protein TNCV_2361651 [Trichonephila clavipes]